MISARSGSDEEPEGLVPRREEAENAHVLLVSELPDRVEQSLQVVLVPRVPADDVRSRSMEGLLVGGGQLDEGRNGTEHFALQLRAENVDCCARREQRDRAAALDEYLVLVALLRVALQLRGRLLEQVLYAHL